MRSKDDHNLGIPIGCPKIQILSARNVVHLRSYYGNHSAYPKIDPLCQVLLLDKENCKCHLSYSICRVSLYLDAY